MKLLPFVGVGLMLLSLPAWSGKVYKWVDDNGHVHYSQVPPPKDQIKDSASVQVKKDAGALPATRRGDYAYCGSMKLPGPLYEPKSILSDLGRTASSWKKSLKNSEQSLADQLRKLGENNLHNNNYASNKHSSYRERDSERRKETARKIAEYRCALSWADRQKKKYADIRKDVDKDLQGAETMYQASLDAAHRDCGYEPKNYSSVNYNEKKLDWKTCMRPHERRINSSKRNVTKLRGQASKFD